jgi:hypothetical protein
LPRVRPPLERAAVPRRDPNQAVPSPAHQPRRRARRKTDLAQHCRGTQLATLVKASALAEDTKTRIVREIIEYEGTHGSCTKTFTRKVKKQLG